MRILSKFKDYYDYIQGYGCDPTLVYDRQTYWFETKHSNNFHISKYFYNVSDYYNIKYIYFCGEIFQFFTSGIRTLLELEDIKFHNEKDYNIIKKIDLKCDKEFINLIPENVPIALIEYRQIICNPLLRKYNFYKHYSAEICYQKIAQYLYTVKESKAKYDGEIMDDSVSDKDMLIAKGFNNFSFKKEKKKK